MELRLPGRTSALRLTSEIRLRSKSLIEMIAGFLELVTVIIITADTLASFRGGSYRSAESSTLLGSRHATSATSNEIVFVEARRV
jgi:hypothetical protein